MSALLDRSDVQRLIAEFSRPLCLEAVQAVLRDWRTALPTGAPPPSPEAITERVRIRLLDAEFSRLRRVVNATGIILHTGLGRAVLPRRAAHALSTLTGCCNLQIDLETGLRGKRNPMVERLLCRLTGAEAALVVNNNAAATFLILTALCKGKEVLVSRGQLIEIGGSYRLPDCIHQSGAVLREVGTTNKTHLRDYAQALSDETGAILRVNPSNYRMVGFVQEVPVRDLVTLRQQRPVLVIDDLGCGALVDLTRFGLPHEPTVQDSVAAGADLVCFSGDKLIGGPQAGIIVGRAALIDRIRKHSLTRMLRVGKLTGMALEHALRLFLTPETLAEEHPTLRMLTADPSVLETRARRIADRAATDGTHLSLAVSMSESEVGGGSLPGVSIPSVALAARSGRLSAPRISALLRRNEPPVIARIRDDAVLLDLRTVLDGEDEEVAQALIRIREMDLDPAVENPTGA